MDASATYLLWSAAALSFLGLALLFLAFWSAQWPSVKGRIEVSFLDSTEEWSSSKTASGTEIYKKQTEEHAFAYSYEVRGRKYLGGNLKPYGNPNWTMHSGGHTETSDSGKILWSGARDLARWYREGVVLDVYYCPIRPQWSCVEPGGFVLPVVSFMAAGVTAYIAIH